MNKVLMAVLVLASVFLLGCTLGESDVYNHLQNQDPSTIHTNTPDEPQEQEVISDHCNGIFTDEEIAARDAERRALTENDIALCAQIPREPLIVECPGQSIIVFYSYQRCLDYFSEQ